MTKEWRAGTPSGPAKKVHLTVGGRPDDIKIVAEDISGGLHRQIFATDNAHLSPWDIFRLLKNLGIDVTIDIH